MANPQKENGYTGIANELLGAIIKGSFNATQLKIIFTVIRNTFGFNRKEHYLSETYIATATGISKRHISTELNRLIDGNVVILVCPATYTKPKILALNKDYELWRLYSGTILQDLKDPSVTVEEYFPPTVEVQTPQQIKNKQIKNNKEKETLEKIEQHFEILWDLYPNKKGKGKVSQKSKKALYKIQIEELVRCIDRYKAEITKNKTAEKYIKHGSTFFNSGYIDYLDSNYKSTTVTQTSNTIQRYPDIKT